MTGVFIAADEGDKKMWRQLPEILGRSFSTVCLWDRPVIDQSLPPDLMLGALGSATRIRPDNAIMIFKRPAPIRCAFPAGERTVAVVDSGADESLLQAVSRTMLPAITCGLSARDTLTLSSFGTDSAVATLQRSVNCFDGSVAEPQEIPLSLAASIDSFTLMAAVAVFVLTGRLEQLPHAVFETGTYK